MPAFQGERMHVYGEFIRELVGRVLDQWPLGRRFELHHQVQEITLDIILRIVLGHAEGPAYERLRGSVARFLWAVSSPSALLFSHPEGTVAFRSLQESLGRLSPWGYVAHRFREIDELLFAEPARRRPRLGGEDVLAMMIAARDERGSSLDDRALRDELLTFILAGHETSAALLAAAVFRLLAHPDVLAQVRDEVAGVAGEGPIEPQRVAELRYLDAVLKETLRLQPVVPTVMRYVEAPMRFGSRDYPGGIYVAPCSYLVHHRPDVWREPLRFEPRRFLDDKPSLSTYFPFGGGARHCIGMAFAM
jgi:cytochrome P450